MNENLPNSDHSELDAILRTLTTNQLRYIVARQECTTDKAAAELVGLSDSTIKQWDNKKDIDRAVRLMALDGVHVATEMRRRALPKAMAIKVAGLDSEVEKMRQDVATEIIEWTMGKAEEKHNISGDLQVQLVWEPHKSTGSNSQD